MTKLVDRLAIYAKNGALCLATGGHVWPPLAVSPPVTWPADAPPEERVTTGECIFCGSTVTVNRVQKMRKGK